MLAQVVNLLPSNASLSAAVHDVGKISPGYQRKYFTKLVSQFAPDLARADLSRFESKHATISAAAIDRWLAIPNGATATAAGGHHGSIARGRASDTAEVYGGEAWARERRLLIDILVKEFGAPPSVEQEHGISVPVLAGLVSVADWIGSDERFFPADTPLADHDTAAAAEHAIHSCGLRVPELRPGRTFEQVFDFSPNSCQEQFTELVTGPGLYVLEAPMGLGKTEAALYAAYKLIVTGQNRGIYFALPTRLTSDRIHERVAKFLDRISMEPASPLLAHGLAWLRAFDERGGRFAPGCKEWFSPLKRALLAPYAVGTIDQALLAVLRVRHNFVRTYGLAGKVVILDEVHSYDMYTGTLLDRLTERLLEIGCSVIVLSATLTTARRNRLAPALAAIRTLDYPLGIRLQGAEAASRSVAPPPTSICQTRIEPWEDDAVARAAVVAAEAGKCVVCIANTVGRAQSWCHAVVNHMRAGSFEVGLLHARFPLFQREAIEVKWVTALGKDGSRPTGCVLVATQLVEQSVDIDADFMISELAPTDMLLQRMGRLWRHSRPERPCTVPEFIVVGRDPAPAASAMEAVELLGRDNSLVYAPYVLLRTHAVWRNLSAVRRPDDIRSLIEDTYAEPKTNESPVLSSLRDALSAAASKLSALAGAAGDNVQGLPVMEDREDVATRYSDLPTTAVLLVTALDAPAPSHAQLTLMNGMTVMLDEFHPDIHATCLLHRNLVTIARHLLPRRGFGVPPKRWLAHHFFHQPPVLLWDPSDGSLTLDGQVTALGYRPDIGIYRTDRTPATQTTGVCDLDPLDSARFDW